MSGRATEVDESTFSQHEDAVSVREVIHIHLGFDVRLDDAFSRVQFVDLNLVVEVADVADDRLIFHLRHMIESDDIDVAGSRDVDVRRSESALKSVDLVAFHRGL